MSKFGKILNFSGKTSTHRAENIFPTYLLYNVHEIAPKYLREKKRYSSLSDSDRSSISLYFYTFFSFVQNAVDFSKISKNKSQETQMFEKVYWVTKQCP